MIKLKFVKIHFKAFDQLLLWQGRSQNLKAVPRNLMEVFKVDDVTANDVIQKKQYRLRKEKLQISHNNHYY